MRPSLLSVAWPVAARCCLPYLCTQTTGIWNKSRAIAGRTARCCCNFRYVLNFTTASCGFSATARLSCIHQWPFKCWNYITLIFTAENHGIRPKIMVKVTVIVNTWLSYGANKCHNKCLMRMSENSKLKSIVLFAAVCRKITTSWLHLFKLTTLAAVSPLLSFFSPFLLFFSLLPSLLVLVPANSLLNPAMEYGEPTSVFYCSNLYLLWLVFGYFLMTEWQPTMPKIAKKSFRCRFNKAPLLVPLPRRTITVSLPPHLDHLLTGGGL